MKISGVFILLFICIIDLADSNEFDILNTYNHDSKCFTQGLSYHEGYIYESCGLYKHSSLRKIDTVTESILVKYEFHDKIFAEGLTVLQNHVYVLTWKNRKVYVFNANTLQLKKILSFENEGWGLTHNNNNLIASDGSGYLFLFQKPSNDIKSISKLTLSFQVLIRDSITNKPLSLINELEYVGGYVYANIWYQDYIYKINITTGVGEKINLATLYPLKKRSSDADCLNGIAFDSPNDAFILTGKLWPKRYHVRFSNHPVDHSYMNHLLDLS